MTSVTGHVEAATPVRRCDAVVTGNRGAGAATTGVGRCRNRSRIEAVVCLVAVGTRPVGIQFGDRGDIITNLSSRLVDREVIKDDVRLTVDMGRTGCADRHVSS